MIFCLAEKKDAVVIAKIHKKEIGQGFLSSLPIIFLEKLYLAIIENDFCVVAKNDKEVVGFIAGTAEIKKLYSFFVRKYLIFSFFVLLPKIFDIRKILENIFYIKKEEIKPELLTVAVSSNFQGQGIAKKMLEIFISEMRKREVKIFKVVVGEDLKPAINFYEKSGFLFLKDISVHHNKKSRIYTYTL